MKKHNSVATHNMKNPRQDALTALTRILYKGESSTDVLNEMLSAYGFAQSRDAGLLHAITMGVLRNLLLLESTLKTVSDRPIKAIDKRVLLAIYTGMLQLLFMDRIPAHAAVDETVKLVQSFRRKAVSFANAVMRTIARQREGLLKDIDRQMVLSSLPKPLLSALKTVAGRNLTRDEIMRLNSPTPTVLRVNQVLIERDRLRNKLVTHGIRAQIAKQARSAIIITKGALSLVDTGAIPRLAVPQDLGSQLVVEVLNPRPGESVIDLCAGRGIKTTQIQEYTDSNASVTAVDISPDKLRLLQGLANKKGLHRISVIQGDATKFRTSETFDKVLLDAPCTGTGTLRRRPEVRYRISETDMGKMTDLQRRMLANALKLVRPRGLIVYAVCSFLPEEGPGVWDTVMNGLTDFQEVDLSQRFPGAPFITSEGRILTLPYRDEMDGFFIAAAIRIDKEDDTTTTVTR